LQLVIDPVAVASAQQEQSKIVNDLTASYCLSLMFHPPVSVYYLSCEIID
jgi:hypothetical protein